MEKASSPSDDVESPVEAVAPPSVSPEGTVKRERNSYVRLFMYNDMLGWITTAIAISCMVASGVLLPLMNFVFGKFVTIFNDFITGRKTPDEFRSSINWYTLYFVYLFVAKFVLSYIWTTLNAINAIRITRTLRIDFLKQTLRQEIGYFDSSDPGSIPGSINRGGNLVHQGIAEKFGLTVQATTTFFAAFVVAFAVQWKLTLICICIVPSILIVVAVCFTFDVPIEKKLNDTWGEADKLAEEVFASIRNVHAFWAYPKLYRKYVAIMDDAKKLGDEKPPVYAVLFSIQFFCIYAGYGLAFWQGIRMYHRGEIHSPGDVVTVILAILLAAQGLTQVAPQIMVVSKAVGAANDLFQRIDRVSKIDALSAGGLRPSECCGEIVFDDVDFSYPSRPDMQVLHSLSLTIPANKTTAIVGPSGSGKSTIVGLIERWFSTSGGRITLDGHKIEDLNIQWLRTNVRLVQQEPVLFSGSIFDNVAYGLSGTSQADASEDVKLQIVVEACKAAYAHDFIETLPEGYNTRIGEGGAMLSGGQRQRLAIARSIVSNPRVLLLDEATSALDPSSERIVQQALNNVASNRTMLVIAHRLSTVKDADNIVVMSKGRIIEQGTHADLIRLGGAYSNLVLAQDLGGHEDNNPKRFRQEDRENRRPSLAETPSVKDLENSATQEEGASINYNVLKSVAVIVKEQRRMWFPCAVVAVTAFIGGGVYPGLAVLFSRSLEAFALKGDAMLERGDFYALMFFVMALGNFVSYFCMGWMSTVVAQYIIRTYRLEIFNSLLRQEIAFFDNPDHGTGALVSRLSSEPDALQELLSSNIALLMTITVNLISSCVLAISYGWKLGLVLTFGALPPLVASGYVRIRLEFKLDDYTASKFANSAAIAAEAVSAIRTVASLAMEHEVLARYENSLRDIARTSVKSLVSTMFWYALSQSVSFLSMALGFWYGGRLLSSGEYTSQQFYTVFIAVIFSGEAAASFFQYTTSITKAQAAANYVFNLRSQVVPDMRDDFPPGTHHSSKDAPRVECKNLGFSYPSRPDTMVLSGVSLTVEPGQFVAFVGASGCGKTTMISLMERYYEPTTGKIILNGTSSAAVHLGQYRRDIALVQQEPVLYEGTIRENITLAIDDSQDNSSRPSVTDEEILDACRQANIETFIASLPDGLATRCGSRGLQLSGGQRQRIAIARALMRKPRLLLLDEATASLDTESERVVQAALDAAAKGGGEDKKKLRTTIAVAHRLSTVKPADVVFVFSRSRIVEVGSHGELVERRGIYYQMCLAQSLDRAD